MVSREVLTSSQGILEDLLKAQEFENGEVDCGVESQASFVWTQGRVKLYAVSAVDLW